MRRLKQRDNTGYSIGQPRYRCVDGGRALQAGAHVRLGQECPRRVLQTYSCRAKIVRLGGAPDVQEARRGDVQRRDLRLACNNGADVTHPDSTLRRRCGVMVPAAAAADACRRPPTLTMLLQLKSHSTTLSHSRIPDSRYGTLEAVMEHLTSETRVRTTPKERSMCCCWSENAATAISAGLKPTLDTLR